jgi:iron-sulfur cluster assembly accessory protein
MKLNPFILLVFIKYLRIMDITLTDTAAIQVRKLLKDRGLSERSGLRVYVKGGGCSGFEYGVDLEEKPSRFELIKSGEKVLISNGVRILTDEKSLMFIRGCTIDWKEVNLGYQFVFENPLSTGTCGCGISFSI